jgi:hypothetical protein
MAISFESSCIVDRAEREEGVRMSTTEYFDVAVAGDQVERLMREVFTDH